MQLQHMLWLPQRDCGMHTHNAKPATSAKQLLKAAAVCLLLRSTLLNLKQAHSFLQTFKCVAEQ